MTEDMSNIFPECEKYLRAALSRWRKHLPELYEDAFQEGMIQCWRDVEAGVTPKLKILRRASMAGNKFMHRNGEYFFGKPRKSRDGIRTNQKSVEKVQVYLQEVMPVRNNVYPNAREVSDALGIAYSSAQNIMRNIKSGKIDHMVYREDGRMDWNHYKTFSVEEMGPGTEHHGDQASNRHWTDDVRFAESFEDALVSDMDMASILSQLSERHRTVLYMYFYQGYSVVSIGEHFGHTTNVSTKGHRHVNNAISQARMLLDPYHGSCEKGHERTPETSYVKQRAGGVWARVCKICREESGTTTAEVRKAKPFKTGRKEREYCPKNHKKDIRDSKGALRCSQCRAAAQKAYTARRREALNNRGS